MKSNEGTRSENKGMKERRKESRWGHEERGSEGEDNNDVETKRVKQARRWKGRGSRTKERTRGKRMQDIYRQYASSIQLQRKTTRSRWWRSASPVRKQMKLKELFSQKVECSHFWQRVKWLHTARLVSSESTEALRTHTDLKSSLTTTEDAGESGVIPNWSKSKYGWSHCCIQPFLLTAAIFLFGSTVPLR